MRANGQRLYQRQLIEGKALTMYQRIGWHREVFHHAAVYMYAAYFKAGTAVRLARTAGDAVTAIEIGNESNRFPFFKAGCIIYFHQLSGQFMAQDAGIL